MLKLRVGLLLDQWTAPHWIAEVINNLQRHPQIELVLVVLNARHDEAPPRRSWLKKLRSNRFLYNRYVRLDARRAAAALAAYPDRDLSAELPPVPTLRVAAACGKHVDRFAETDIAQIRAANLDILVRFGFRILKGEILHTARYGVWSYHHGDNDEYRGGPAGFWEVAERNPVSGAILQVLSEELDGGRVLAKCQTPTDPTSPARNRLNIQLASVVLMRDAIERLLRLAPTPEQFFSGYAAPSKPYTRRLYKGPTNREMVPFLTRQLFQMAHRRFIRRPANDHQWSIGVIPDHPFPQGAKRLRDVRWYAPRTGRFVADPFAVERDGRTHVFVEEYLSEENRGRISVMTLDAEGAFSEPRPVLDAPFHRSFPFLFEDQGRLYLMPEQQAAGTVALYECVAFPDRWREARVLLEIPAVDSALYRHDGKWWLFTTRSDYGNNVNNLHLYSAATLEDEFIPHPQNPVCIGVAGSRMAGALFEHQGELIRPGQNCVDGYGRSVIFHRVLELTETTYREERLHEVLPDAHSAFGEKFHCINRAGAFHVVDGARRLAA